MHVDTRVVTLTKENGRKVSVKPFGNDKVVVTVWRKNDAPLLALILTHNESSQLREHLLSSEVHSD